MSRTFLILAALNGFAAVALGAFGAHALESLLPPARLVTWGTGVQYHMFHVAALVAAAFAADRFGGGRALRWSGLLFLAGIVLFSGSLYLLALSGLRWLGMITPLGGVAFLAGWGLLAIGVGRRS